MWAGLSASTRAGSCVPGWHGLVLASLARTAEVPQETKPLQTGNIASEEKTSKILPCFNHKFQMDVQHLSLPPGTQCSAQIGGEQFRKTEVKIARLEPNDSQVMFMEVPKFKQDKRGNLMADTGMKLSKRTGEGLKTNKTLMFTKISPVKMARALSTSSLARSVYGVPTCDSRK